MIYLYYRGKRESCQDFSRSYVWGNLFNLRKNAPVQTRLEWLGGLERLEESLERAWRGEKQGAAREGLRPSLPCRRHGRVRKANPLPPPPA